MSIGRFRRGAFAVLGATGMIAAMQLPALAAAGSITSCQNDGSVSVELCTTIYYDKITCKGTPCYKVTSFKVKARKLNSSVVLKTIQVVEGAYSQSYNPTTQTFGVYLQASNSVQASVSPPSNNVWYSGKGKWPTTYGRVFTTANQYRGAWGVVKWSRSGSTTNYIFTQDHLLLQG